MTRRSSLRFCTRREPGACAVLVDDVATRAQRSSTPEATPLPPERGSARRPVRHGRRARALVNVPNSEGRLARRAIERGDPLFAVSVREVPDVVTSGARDQAYPSVG